MNKILVLTRNQENFLLEVNALGLKDAIVVAPETEKEILEHIVDSNIIYGIPYLINKYVHLAEKLEWVQSTFAGIDALVSDDLRKDYALTNVKDVYGDIMSEYVVGYMLMFEKNILGNIENQKNRVWAQRAYPSVNGKTVGIMGTGSIGSNIAQRLGNFGMDVIGYNSSGAEKKYFSTVYGKTKMNEFLSQCDYIVSVLPNTLSTQGIINGEVFSQMKDTAVFINVGRGANVVEDDIIHAIKNKEIAGAVLDVFNIEPLEKSSELWELENIFITPHVSGYDENNEPILKIFRENYDRFVGGKELLHKVNFNKGY